MRGSILLLMALLFGGEVFANCGALFTNELNALLAKRSGSNRVGSCALETEVLAQNLFLESDQRVRLDWYRVGAKHYHLRMGSLIIDPTLAQFFEGVEPFIFVGTLSELRATVEKLLGENGYNSALGLYAPRRLGASEFVYEYFEMATPFRTGQQLVKYQKPGHDARAMYQRD